MDAPAILTQCTAAGLILTLGASGFNAAPKHALTDELRGLLRDHKPAILAHLQDRAATQAEVKEALTRLRAWQATAGDVQVTAAAAILTAAMAWAADDGDLTGLRELVGDMATAQNDWINSEWPHVPSTPAIRWACSPWPGDDGTLPDAAQNEELLLV